jgi:hypothetical protein
MRPRGETQDREGCNPPIIEERLRSRSWGPHKKIPDAVPVQISCTGHRNPKGIAGDRAGDGKSESVVGVDSREGPENRAVGSGIDSGLTSSLERLRCANDEVVGSVSVHIPRAGNRVAAGVLRTWTETILDGIELCWGGNDSEEENEKCPTQCLKMVVGARVRTLFMSHACAPSATSHRS